MYLEVVDVDIGERSVDKVNATQRCKLVLGVKVPVKKGCQSVVAQFAALFSQTVDKVRNFSHASCSSVLSTDLQSNIPQIQILKKSRSTSITCEIIIYLLAVYGNELRFGDLNVLHDFGHPL